MRCGTTSWSFLLSPAPDGEQGLIVLVPVSHAVPMVVEDVCKLKDTRRHDQCDLGAGPHEVQPSWFVVGIE